jgi:hypothetical protein
MLQVVVKIDGGFGRPSSLAVPMSVADAGNAIAVSGPALTTGAWLTIGAGLTTTVISSKTDKAPSDAVKRSRYVPAVENVAVVEAAFGGVNVTVPGPLAFDQVRVRVPGGAGSPSSLAVPDSAAPPGNVTALSVPALTTGA